MRPAIRSAVLVLASLALLTPMSVSVAASAQAVPVTGEATRQPAAARKITGKALLGNLKVRPERTGTYKREKFGKLWADADRDCQDTRSEVMQAESRAKVTFYSARRCAVLTGRWKSWYDGKTWTDAQKLEIDHVVALGETWKSGAWKWKKDRRFAYANDLDHDWTLDAITRQVNQDKSDQDPAEWLPARNRCTYAQHWVTIKYRWGLSVDTAEKKALTKLLSGDCGRKKLTVPARAA